MDLVGVGKQRLEGRKGREVGEEERKGHPKLAVTEACHQVMLLFTYTTTVHLPPYSHILYQCKPLPPRASALSVYVVFLLCVLMINKLRSRENIRDMATLSAIFIGIKTI